MKKGRVNYTVLARPQVYVLNERFTWGLLNFSLDQCEPGETLLMWLRKLVIMVKDYKTFGIK